MKTMVLALALAMSPIAGLADGPAAAADSHADASDVTRTDVRVRVWPHQGYGRIVFDWPSAVPYEAKVVDGLLSVRFDAPFAASLEDIHGRLSDYVEAARMGSDGRSVEVALKAGVGFKAFTSGASVVIDLVRGNPANAAKPDATPTVPVRSGAHATFNRFVFDWARAVNYDVTRQDDEAVIRFDRSAVFDLAAVQRNLPPFVRAITPRSDGNTVALRLAEGTQVRHFRSGTSVVLDVLHSGAPQESRPAGATTVAKNAPVAIASNAPEQPAAAVAPKVIAPVSPSKPAVSASGDVPQASKALADAEKPPTSLLPAEVRTVAATPDQAVPVILTLERGAAVIRFHWPEDVGAAVFTRGGSLWAAFDRRARLAFDGWDEALAKPSPNSRRRPEEKPAAAFVARPQFTSVDGLSVFRMKIPDGINPSVAREKSTWIVSLERESLQPAAGIPVESHVGSSSGARLYIDAPHAYRAVAVPDPEVGDRLWVVPLRETGRGIGLGRAYAEVELLATAQGIAGYGLSDGVAFHVLPNGIEIRTRAGLTLSGTNVTARRSVGEADSGGKRGRWLLDLEGWKRSDQGSFVENKHILQRAAAMAPPTTRNADRLKLAQLLFAYENYSDVLGVLEVIEQDEPQRAQEPVFRVMRGAANYWLRNYERAGIDIGHPSLDEFREIALWRAGLAAMRKDWPTASRYFNRSAMVLRDYPVKYRVHFGLLAAEAALDIGDMGLAEYHLEGLELLALDRSDQAAADYMRGRLLAKTMDPEGAVAAWTEAMTGPDRRVRVLAALARTDLLLAKKKIDLRQAIEALEKLRFAWRGDGLEFRVLRRLGEAYIAAEDYRNGLMTLRELATHFPKHPEADEIIAAMRAAFVTLYVNGAADRLPPLTSLALYDQFRELTPDGEVGNELVARLAERLVAVDLLDRAATLIRHLVDQRLTGSERFDAQNRLAFVYLLDRKPQAAFDALAGQLPADILPKIAEARRHLKARALADLARYREALALIADDGSSEAEQLRADAYWKLRDWAHAAVAYKRLVDAAVKADGARENGDARGSASDEAALDEATQNQVMSLAIARALSRDQAGLAALRQRFLARMSKTRYKESFDVVTAPAGNVPDNYSVIASRVAEVDQYRAFMQGYRQKLLARGQRPDARPSKLPSAAVLPSVAGATATTRG